MQAFEDERSQHLRPDGLVRMRAGDEADGAGPGAEHDPVERPPLFALAQRLERSNAWLRRARFLNQAAYGLVFSKKHAVVRHEVGEVWNDHWISGLGLRVTYPTYTMGI